jgi:Right handed beta helix region
LRTASEKDISMRVLSCVIPACCLLVSLMGIAAAAEPAGAVPDFSWMPKAPALPAPAGEVLRVATVEELFAAAEKVKPGGTILVADGHYLMPRYFELHTDNVTLRSASGRREKVILDGAQSRHGELVGVTACSGVTIADLTIQNIKYNGFKINSNLKATRVTIRNCVIHNIWQRGIKGPAVPKAERDRFRPTDCRIEYCLFYNDRPKRMEDDPGDQYKGDYVGGIDIMCARGWTIRDNVFYAIHGRNRLGRGAVFVWNESEDCVIERNAIVDCDAGICMGNSFKGPETPVHATRCTVRNNFVTRCPETGILADYTRDCKIVHNTIHDPGSRLQRLIRLVHDNDGLAVANNLLSGPPMRNESQSPIQVRGNVARDLTPSFVDPKAGNLHLKAAVAGVAQSAERLAEVPEDIDRRERGKRTDVGADEWRRGKND